MVGPITTVSDLAGRITSYTDVWGKTTTYSYDQPGRLTDTSGPLGAVHTDYDAAGKPTAQKLDGATVATPSYNSAGELSSVSYNANATSLSSITRDSFGRTTGLDWRQAGGAVMTTNTVARSQSGKVIDESIDGEDVYSGNNFGYDLAGRLTSARVPGHTLTYGFTSSPSCTLAPSAYKNTNRSSVTDNAATTTYCYDAADKLVSTTDPRYPGISYDSHGNTATLGAQILGYDGSDRHMTTGAADTTITYTRDATDRITSRTQTTPATIALRAHASSTNGVGGASLVLPKPAAVAAGDLLIAQVSASGGSLNTITAPEGWSLIDSTANGVSVVQGMFQKTATSSEPSDYSFGLLVPGSASGGIASYTGVDSASPVDGFSADTTALVANSVTTTRSGARLVAAYGASTATSATPPAAMTELYDLAGTLVSSETSEQSLGAAGPTGARTATAAAATSSVNHLVALRPAMVTTTTRYGFAGSGDSPDFTMDTSNNVTERVLGLAGGVVLTKRSGTDVYSYPNIHGDVAATANQTGAKVGPTMTYDPYGQELVSTPDNLSGDADFSWVGQHRRMTEHAAGIATIEMGARQYVAGLGRFLEVDPVEGGSANDYDYANGDCVNGSDLNGMAPSIKWTTCQTNFGKPSTWQLTVPLGLLLRGAGFGPQPSMTEHWRWRFRYEYQEAFLHNSASRTTLRLSRWRIIGQMQKRWSVGKWPIHERRLHTAWKDTTQSFTQVWGTHDQAGYCRKPVPVTEV